MYGKGEHRQTDVRYVASEAVRKASIYAEASGTVSTIT